MTVRLVGESSDEGAERARLLLKSVEDLQPQPPETPAHPKPGPPNREHLIELMGVLARILGFRFQLFMGFLGAAGLGGYAVWSSDAVSLSAAGLYDLLVFLPILFVAFKRG